MYCTNKKKWRGTTSQASGDRHDQERHSCVAIPKSERRLKGSFVAAIGQVGGDAKQAKAAIEVGAGLMGSQGVTLSGDCCRSFRIC